MHAAARRGLLWQRGLVRSGAPLTNTPLTNTPRWLSSSDPPLPDKSVLRLRGLPAGTSEETLERLVGDLGWPIPVKIGLPAGEDPEDGTLVEFSDQHASEAALACFEGASVVWEGVTLEAELWAGEDEEPVDRGEGEIDQLTRLRMRLATDADHGARIMSEIDHLIDLDGRVESEEQMRARRAAEGRRTAAFVEELDPSGVDATSDFSKVRSLHSELAELEDLDAELSELMGEDAVDLEGRDAAAAPQTRRPLDEELVGQYKKISGAEGASAGPGDSEEEDKSDLASLVLPGNWAETVVKVDTVQKVTTGGRIMTYRALVVSGNLQGAGGFGMGRGTSPQDAIARALRKAKSRLIYVDRLKNVALSHSLEGHHNNCRVVIRALPPGYGNHGGPLTSMILRQMGLNDFSVKSYGRRTTYSVVRALFKALARHTPMEDVARIRGMRLIELEWRRGSY